MQVNYDEIDTDPYNYICKWAIDAYDAKSKLYVMLKTNCVYTSKSGRNYDIFFDNVTNKYYVNFDHAINEYYY